MDGDGVLGAGLECQSRMGDKVVFGGVLHCLTMGMRFLRKYSNSEMIVLDFLGMSSSRGLGVGGGLLEIPRPTHRFTPRDEFEIRST